MAFDLDTHFGIQLHETHQQQKRRLRLAHHLVLVAHEADIVQHHAFTGTNGSKLHLHVHHGVGASLHASGLEHVAIAYATDLDVAVHIHLIGVGVLAFGLHHLVETHTVNGQVGVQGLTGLGIHDRDHDLLLLLLLRLRFRRRWRRIIMETDGVARERPILVVDHQVEEFALLHIDPLAEAAAHATAHELLRRILLQAADGTVRFVVAGDVAAHRNDLFQGHLVANAGHGSSKEQEVDIIIQVVRDDIEGEVGGGR